MDMRGYGESEKPEGVDQYKLSVLIKDIQLLIEALGKAFSREYLVEWLEVYQEGLDLIYHRRGTDVSLIHSLSHASLFHSPVTPKKLLQGMVLASIFSSYLGKRHVDVISTIHSCLSFPSSTWSQVPISTAKVSLARLVPPTSAHYFCLI